MSQAEALYRLQEIELGILAAQKRLQEISAALQDNAALIQAQHRVDSAQKTLKPLQIKMRDLELEIQSNLSKTKTTEDSLYSGKVKNPKELQEMQQEIAALKQWHATLENRLLETMVEVEEAESQLQTAQDQLHTTTQTSQNQYQHLLDEKADLEQKVAALHIQRKDAQAHVQPDNLKRYAGMRARKNNQPVAVLRDISCSVCGIEQTSARAQEVRRGGDLVTCVNCERILVHLG